MKKTIILSLLAAVFAFSNVVKANELTISGYAEWLGASVDQTISDGGASPGTDFSGFDNGTYTRLDGTYATTLDSGLDVQGNMTIHSRDCMGDRADKLLNIEVDFAVAELHLSEINDGIVSMNKVDFIEIPAQIARSLKPGGYHVMFSKFNIELIDESELIGVLNFELAGEIKVVFEVETQKNKDDYTEH